MLTAGQPWRGRLLAAITGGQPHMRAAISAAGTTPQTVYTHLRRDPALAALVAAAWEYQRAHQDAPKMGLGVRLSPAARVERIAEARRRYRGGESTWDLAAAMHVDQRTVRRWLADEVRRRPGRPARPDVRDAKILGLRKEGLSYAEIGRRIGMSPTGVRMRHYALISRARPDRR